MFLKLGSKILFYFYIKYWIHTPLAFFFFCKWRKNWKEHWWLAIYRLVKHYYFLFAKIYIFKMLFLKEFANFIQGKTSSFLITNMVFLMNMRKLWQFFIQVEICHFHREISPYLLWHILFSLQNWYESIKTETNKICFEISRIKCLLF